MKLTSSSVALVTGGASGLGEATVRRLHAAGAAVVVADLDRGLLDRRFVEGVGVEGLRAAQHGGERLNRHAGDVVERLLRGQAYASGL